MLNRLFPDSRDSEICAAVVGSDSVRRVEAYALSIKVQNIYCAAFTGGVFNYGVAAAVIGEGKSTSETALCRFVSNQGSMVGL